MTNKELADIFNHIADLLEIKGEVIYKVLAYRRAATSLVDSPLDLAETWRETGKLPKLAGIGEALAAKLEELLTTGKLGFFEKLKQEVPAGVADMLAIPDVGPKRAALFWKQLGLVSVAELEAAARSGKLRDLPGMGEKSEAKIVAGIEMRRRSANRVPLGVTWPLAQDMVRFLRSLPGVELAEAAGSLRRMRSTIGDLDFLAGADPARADAIMQAFVHHPKVVRVLALGSTKSSVELGGGLQADLRVVPPQRFGTCLQYFTGSKDHNVRLRELALTKGFSLNEYALTKKSGQEVLCPTETEVYRTLGLSYVPPELREDRGELEAAGQGKLPRLVEMRDLQSELHAHSTWSDGTLSVADMAQLARSHGLKCLALTDHSQSLGITHGLTPTRLRAQRQEIERVQAEMGQGFSLLHGAEVEIRADGQLDYSDDVLSDLDVVIAALHVSLRQDRATVTARLVDAIRNRHVDIIAHPTGRLLPDREGADLDMEAVLHAAAESGVVLEINAHPARLDLDDVYARRALELGCLLAINTDAHRAEDFGAAFFGVGVARRAWIPAESVINTWPVEKLLQWLDERGHRPKRRTSAEVLAGVPATATGAARPSSRRPKASKPAAKPAQQPVPAHRATSTRKTAPTRGTASHKTKKRN
jgi:DNA polymerase (family 10)